MAQISSSVPEKANELFLIQVYSKPRTSKSKANVTQFIVAENTKTPVSNKRSRMKKNGTLKIKRCRLMRFRATIIQSTSASECGINPVDLVPLRKELAGCGGVGFEQVTYLESMSKTSAHFSCAKTQGMKGQHRAKIIEKRSCSTHCVGTVGSSFGRSFPACSTKRRNQQMINQLQQKQEPFMHTYSDS
jgi:hypothetical protein